jgi:hypothetical protein
MGVLGLGMISMISMHTGEVCWLLVLCFGFCTLAIIACVIFLF